MKVTIIEDSMGSLHVWKGRVVPTGYKYTWKVDGKWADIYIQDSESCASVLDYLKAHNKKKLASGYAVTAEIPSIYFSE